MAVRRRPGRAASASAHASPACARPPRSTTCWRTRARRGRARHAGADARRRWPSASWRPASTASSRSRWRSTSPPPSARSRAARETGRVLMVGHLLEYHPAVAKLKEIADAGELGDIHYIYSNRLNLGKLRADENALWSLGAHDVSVVLRLAGEEPFEVAARGESYIHQGVEDVVFAFLRFPSGLAAHLHLSWLDPHKERRFTVVGLATHGDVRRHGARAQGHRLRQGLRRGLALLRRVHHPLGRHLEPAGPQPRAAADRVRALLECVRDGRTPPVRRRVGAARRARARGAPGGPRRELGASRGRSPDPRAGAGARWPARERSDARSSPEAPAPGHAGRAARARGTNSTGRCTTHREHPRGGPAGTAKRSRRARPRRCACRPRSR